MALTAIVDNGKIVDTGATTSSNSKSENKNAVNEDMFLSLLVAEMKYQDPLEPTSNTEWVSQYATFTQIEQGTEMQKSVKQLEAAQLVGKEVIMKTTNEVTGESSYFSGIVDYMYVEEGEIFLSIGEQLYNIKDLDTVVNSQYMAAVQAAKDFQTMMDQLPLENALTSQDASLVESVRAAYNKMSDYEKGFIPKEYVEKLEKYEQAITRLKGTDSTDDIEDVNETEDENSEEVTETDNTDEASDSTENKPE